MDSNPPEGWGERFGYPTWTVYGPSWDVHPPNKEGYTPVFIGRHGTAYTTWVYRKDEQ